MTNPTPDQITAAVMLLQSAPGIRGTDTLDQIERNTTPTARMGRELVDWINSIGTNRIDLTPYRMADLLATMARHHGLRITTDPEPGELIQFRLVRRAANGWFLHDPSVSYESSQGGLDAAESDRAKYADPEGCCPRIVAVRLLPEGGKA